MHNGNFSGPGAYLGGFLRGSWWSGLALHRQHLDVEMKGFLVPCLPRLPLLLHQAK
jgi:hypothetical protein